MHFPLASILSAYLEQAQLSQVSLIAPLTQGLSNQNYYIRGLHPSKPRAAEWVLRINSWASSQICNRQHEVLNWQLASQAKLAPQLVYVSPDKQFYLSEFFAQNEQRCWSDLITANASHPIVTMQELWPGAEYKLLELLNGLKKLPAPNNVMGFDEQWQVYQRRLELMQQQLRTHKLKSLEVESWLDLHSQLVALKQQVGDMLARLAGCLVNLQFSHRDLNPYNILVVEDKLKCIDFEYACSSHPLSDLASVIASHSLSSEQRRWLIENYLSEHPNLNSKAGNAVPAAVDLYWVFAVCWALQMAFDCLDGDSLNSNSLNNDGLPPDEAIAVSRPSCADYLTYGKQYRDLIASCV
ncbi:phosphotransferase [Shewanella pealeana]|uniref:Aminoglycoside phosphotransferase n=1 Tax=Shewanella pealeana (strain ATCC 700345 / ANG-SQ1) TaxID=398579 RepID=A8H3L7_SHEPA|nr:phosphotransferase [Shewanella pealeana]ABV87154.1 aminoglycoside phosphotransferase [Shewanella pealeana ATCC 700345]